MAIFIHLRFEKYMVIRLSDRQGLHMDMPMRLIIAFSIIAGGIAIAIPFLFISVRRRRADKLRRRGVKSYNRSQNVARGR